MLIIQLSDGTRNDRDDSAFNDDDYEDCTNIKTITFKKNKKNY